MNEKSINILEIKVDKTTKALVLDRITHFLANNKKFYIVTPNPEIILAAQNNPHLKKVLNNADISVPDGVGLKLAHTSLEIIKGRELMFDLISMAHKDKLKLFFLGASESINAMTLEHIRDKYPGLVIAGSSGPFLNSSAEPASDKEKQKEMSVIENINKFKPDILFIAFGAPKQEIWLDKWKSKLQVRGLMTVGGSFDYLVGAKIPSIFADLGLEWLMRLVREPSRIGRIVNAVFVFPLVLLKSKLSD